jgi:hypothetical protein
MISAYAQEVASADMNALDALGINTSEAPEGYDENDRSNPYGKDTVTLNPVGEFYSVGLSTITTTTSNMPTRNTERATADTKILDPQILEGTLYGHEKWNISNPVDMMNVSNTNKYSIAGGISTVTGTYKASEIVEAAPSALQSIDVNTTVGGNAIALTSVAAGNFDGNTEGLKSQVAMLYTTKLDKNGGLYLKVGDITGDYGSESKLLLSTTANIGNPSASLDGNIIENFSTDPYLMQNYLQITTGDYDGDGKDEIAVYIPELGKSRIEVYKLRTTTGSSSYKTASQWSLAWTYSLKETTYVSNMVSMSSGDFNSDGVDDIAITWGYYYGPNDNKGSTAVVLFGSSSDGRMLQNSQEFPLTYGSSGIVRGSFAFGDITGGGQDTLILGGQLNSDLTAGNLNSRFVAFYSWDGSSFVQTQASNFNLFSRDSDNNLIYPAMTRNTEIFYSSPLCVTNIDVIGQGLGEYAKLYIDSLLFSYSDSGLELEAALDNKTMQENPGTPVSYVEYDATATDLVGLGKESFMTMKQTFSYVETEEISQTVTEPRTYTYYEMDYYYKNWFNKLFNIKTWYPVLRTITITEETTLYDTNTYYHPGKAYQIAMDVKEDYFNSKIVDLTTSICVANTDQDTTFLNYAGKYFVYSDPEILAVLASPPYFGDLLDRDDLSGNYAESTTSYSTTKGSGTGITANATISLGAYVSVEQEFSVFGVKVAQAEAEVAIKSSFTYEYEQSSLLEQTVSYTAAAGEDMVAFYSIPLEVFKFNASVPDGSGGYKTQTMTVNIPHEAAVRLLSLDEYESIAADYDILPQISDNVLTHTLGEPSSYPASSNGYNVIAQYTGPPAAVGFSGTGGGASIGQEIAMSKESSNAFSVSVGVETKIGAGPAGVVVGVTAGAEAGAGMVFTTTSGNSFSGEMQNMPIEAQEYSYGYNWRIFSYAYNDGTYSFPVVNYIVSNVTAPPSLPTDFEQDVSETTDKSIALTWSYDKTVAGFQIYKYYEFPEGSGSYEIGFVSASSGVQGDDGKYYYSFTDENLAPYTEYGYQIQTVRAAVPNNSIKSEVLTARTKTSNGYPNINLIGEGLTNNLLPIYPDSTSTITATVSNAVDYPDGLSYQWQILTSNGWSNMSGQTNSSLTFRSAGSADQAQYRCRINVVYYDENQGNTYYISAFSEPFYAKYSKRTATLADKGFTAISTNDTIDLSLSLISGHVNHNTAPTGTVTFMIRGVDYYSTATGELLSDGTQNGKSITTATASIKNLNDGVYEVTAVYNGSRIFKSLTISESQTVLIGDSAGYQLNLLKDSELLTSFIYGNEITPVLNEITMENNEVIKTPLTSDVTYAIKDSQENIIQSLITESFNTPSVGNYTLVARIGADEVASRNFIVSPNPITVLIADKTAEGGNVEENMPVISLSEESFMSFDESLDDLNLIYVARNTADNIITLDNDTKPGNYTITPMPSETSYLNDYDITYISGVFTVTAQTYNVTYEASKVSGTLAGTIELTNSGSRFSSSVDLLFAANPYNGFEIDTWTVIPIEDNGQQTTDESRHTIQTGKSTLHYEMKDEPIHVIVTFKKPELTLTAFTQGGGDILYPQYFTSGSIVTSGAEMEFTAIPDEGYHFVKWEKIENNVTSRLTGLQNQDGSNTVSLTMSNYSTRLYAYFERDSYTINLGDNLKASYYYDDDGLSLTPDIEKIIFSGASIIGDTEITISTKTGYTIAEDAEWLQTGSELGVASSDNQSYVFTITDDTEILVDTQREKYSIALSSENGSTSITVDGSSISSDSLDNVEGGSRITVTATPDYGYAFDHWEINGSVSNQTSTTFIESELGRSLVIEAHFRTLDDYEITVIFDNPLRASFTYTIVDKLGRTQINNEAISNPEETGDIISLYEGDTFTINVTPSSNFMVGKWIINDTVHDSRQKTFTIDDIQQDISIQVDMVAQSSHRVTFGSNIIKATTDGFEFASGDYVGGGTTVIFYANPDSDEMVSQWTVNSDVVLNDYNNPFIGDTYTIDGLSGLVNTEVSFEPKIFHEVNVNTSNISYTTSFEPILENKIRDGATGTFTFNANAGYRLDLSDLEGLNIFDEISGPDTAGKYTCIIKSIKENIDIDIAAEKLYTITTLPSSGGSITISSPLAAEGDVITLTATPSNSYNLKEISAAYLNSELEETKLTITNNRFTMPAADVSASASFTYQGGGGGGGAILPETFIITVSYGSGGSITPKTTEVESGNSASFNISPDEGYIIDDVTVNGQSLGAISSYIFENVTSDMSIAASFKKSIEIPDIKNWQNQFNDIDADNWFYEAVGFVTEMGLFRGTSDNQFSPNNTMSRGMLVTVLYRLEGESKELNSGFSDVDPSQWYAEGVIWASSNDIVSGYGNNKFGPDDLITREQIAVILYRYGKLKGYNMTSSGNIGAFTDNNEVSNYALDPMKWAVGEGLINGKNNEKLDPSGEATRAEVAAILMRFIKKYL